MRKTNSEQYQLDQSKPEQESAAEPQSVIYCGPSFPTGILLQHTVFTGGAVPKHLEEHIKSCPAIDRLMVPVDQLSNTLLLLQTAGSAENSWFSDIRKYIIQGGV